MNWYGVENEEGEIVALFRTYAAAHHFAKMRSLYYPRDEEARVLYVQIEPCAVNIRRTWDCPRGIV